MLVKIQKMNDSILHLLFSSSHPPLNQHATCVTHLQTLGYGVTPACEQTRKWRLTLVSVVVVLELDGIEESMKILLIIYTSLL